MDLTVSHGISKSIDFSKDLITLTEDFSYDDAPKNVVITLIDSETDVSLSKNVIVANAAEVREFKLGDVTLPGKSQEDLCF